MATASKTLEQLIGEIFDATRDIDDEDIHAIKRSEFIFHMTDWKDDLQRLAKLYSDPDNVDEEEAREIIAATLYHATGHLIAAAKIYDFVPDPFDALGKWGPDDSPSEEAT